MGFQVNGVEYINNSGVFTNGLKTALNQSMAGTGAITTGQPATYGTNYGYIGSINAGVAYNQNFTPSGNLGFSSSNSRRGCQLGSTISGWNLGWNPAQFTDLYSMTVASGLLSGATTITFNSGTWRAISCGGIDPSTNSNVFQLFIRIS